MPSEPEAADTVTQEAFSIKARSAIRQASPVAGHFEAVGFEGERDSIAQFMWLAVEAGTVRRHLDGGATNTWRDPSGASVVVHIDPDGAVACASPSFDATSRVPIGGGVLALDPDCRFCSPVLFEVVEDDELLYPLAVVLENIDEILDGNVDVPAGVLALTAFAEEIAVWPDQRAYEDAGLSPTMASKSLIPSGLFFEEPARRRLFRRPRRPESRPNPRAIITGIVETAETVHNEATNTSFVHAKVDTYGATVDCVLSTRELTSELSAGNLVQGSFWLIGRTVPPT
jgi:hypothetical protein